MTLQSPDRPRHPSSAPSISGRRGRASGRINAWRKSYIVLSARFAPDALGVLEDLSHAEVRMGSPICRVVRGDRPRLFVPGPSGRLW